MFFKIMHGNDVVVETDNMNEAIQLQARMEERSCLMARSYPVTITSPPGVLFRCHPVTGEVVETRDRNGKIIPRG
jgi:hypothetical protein